MLEQGKGPQTPSPSPAPPSPLRCGANKNRRKSHYPWTKNGGQVSRSISFRQLQHLNLVVLQQAARGAMERGNRRLVIHFGLQESRLSTRNASLRIDWKKTFSDPSCEYQTNDF